MKGVRWVMVCAFEDVVQWKKIFEHRLEGGVFGERVFKRLT